MEELSLAQYVMINWTYGHSLVSMRRGNRLGSSSFIDINLVMVIIYILHSSSAGP